MNSTWACRQTRPENNGAKVFRRATNSGGKDSKEHHFQGHLHTTVPSQNGQSRAKKSKLSWRACWMLVFASFRVSPHGVTTLRVHSNACAAFARLRITKSS